MTCPRSLSSVGTHCAGVGFDLTLGPGPGLGRGGGFRWLSNCKPSSLWSPTLLPSQRYTWWKRNSLAGVQDLRFTVNTCTPPSCTYFSLSLPCQLFTLPPSPRVLGSIAHEYSRGDKWLCLSVLESPSIANSFHLSVLVPPNPSLTSHHILNAHPLVST